MGLELEITEASPEKTKRSGVPVCPPAPRKPWKRKSKLVIGFKKYHPVPEDLESLFLPLPPCKRFRMIPKARNCSRTNGASLPLASHTISGGMFRVTRPPTYLSPLFQFMEEEPEECNTSLALGISGYRSKKSISDRTATTLRFDALFPNHSKEVEDVVISGKETSNCSSEEFLGPPKKLKLTKEQVFLLEQSYSECDTVNTSQKQDLADRLRIQPRQVEVWFQNRRARTKTRQMEMDYECLKRYSERLSEENRRLKKEMMHLLKAATVTASMCPSCERRNGLAAGAGKSAGQLATVNAVLLSRRS